MSTKISYNSEDLVSFTNNRIRLKTNGKQLVDDIIVEANDSGSIDPSYTTAVPSDVRDGKMFYAANGNLVEGVMPDAEFGEGQVGSKIGDIYADTTTKYIHATAGYLDGGGHFKINPISVVGADASKLLTGSHVKVNNGAEDLIDISGTMTNRGSVSQTISPGGSYTIPEGYHDGTGTVAASGIPSDYHKFKTETLYASSTATFYHVNGGAAVTAYYVNYTVPAEGVDMIVAVADYGYLVNGWVAEYVDAMKWPDGNGIMNLSTLNAYSGNRPVRFNPNNSKGLTIQMPVSVSSPANIQVYTVIKR